MYYWWPFPSPSCSHDNPSSSQSIKYSLSSSSLRLEPSLPRSLPWRPEPLLVRSLSEPPTPLQHMQVNQEKHFAKPHPVFSSFTSINISECNSLAAVWCQSVSVEEGLTLHGSFLAGSRSWCSVLWTVLEVGVVIWRMWSSRDSLSEWRMSLDVMVLLSDPCRWFNFFSAQAKSHNALASYDNKVRWRNSEHFLESQLKVQKKALPYPQLGCSY